MACDEAPNSCVGKCFVEVEDLLCAFLVYILLAYTCYFEFYHKANNQCSAFNVSMPSQLHVTSPNEVSRTTTEGKAIVCIKSFMFNLYYPLLCALTPRFL